MTDVENGRVRLAWKNVASLTTRDPRVAALRGDLGDTLGRFLSTHAPALAAVLAPTEVVRDGAPGTSGMVRDADGTTTRFTARGSRVLVVTSVRVLWLQMPPVQYVAWRLDQVTGARTTAAGRLVLELDDGATVTLGVRVALVFRHHLKRLRDLVVDAVSPPDDEVVPPRRPDPEH